MTYVELRCEFVDREKRFSLDVDLRSGRTFVSIPVQNRFVQYDENYEVDRATFARFLSDPSLAYPFVERARRRELDHLLLFKPGSDRGDPT